MNTPNDIPGILALGAQYEVLKNLRVMAGYNHYFDKDARMDNNKQRSLSITHRSSLLVLNGTLTHL